MAPDLTADLEFALEALRVHQSSPWLHPYTCGHDSNHPPLEPVIDDGELALRCPACPYDQPIRGLILLDLIERGREITDPAHRHWSALGTEGHCILCGKTIEPAE